MYSYDPLALFYFFREDDKAENSEEKNANQEQMQQKEREWQAKWYNLNNNGIEIN